ncbi:MAG: hypothetical protein COA58_15645 [Bacteroidetes bacterium]|nr:MAG: hypothetical protein COA58_15645 [Bacteroidota bacterium]
MKVLITIFGLLLLNFVSSAQNHICTAEENGLSVELRTDDTIYVQINTTYVPVAAIARSTKFDSTQISITLTTSVDASVLGCYQNTYLATDPNGDNLTCIRVVCIREIAKVTTLNLDFRLFPNPATSKTLLTVNQNLQGSKKLTLVDILGNTVYSQEFIKNETTIQTSHLPRGIYFVNVSNGIRRNTQRLIVN